MAQSKDRTLKYISVKFLAVLLSLLNFEIEFDLDDVEELTDELIILESQLKRPDRVVRLGDIILMIEFQSTYVTKKLKKKFKLYVSAFDFLKNVNDNEIIFCVLSTKENSKWIHYSSGPCDNFSFPIFSFRDLDLEKIINNIESKIRSNDIFTVEELVKLAVTPLIPEKREDIIEQFYITADLISKITFYDSEIKDSVCGIALLLSEMYFKSDDPIRKQIQGVYMAKIDCIKEFGDEKFDEGKSEGIVEGISEGIAKGISEGISEGKIDTIKNMLADDLPLEKISQYTGFSISEIEKIKNQL